MRIAYLLTTSVGGIGRHVGSVAARLVRRGQQVQVFCPPGTARAQGYAAAGLAVRPLSRLDRSAGADLLHAHGLRAGALALPVARTLRVPLVVSWHNAPPPGPAGRRLARTVARRADLVLGASSDLVVLAQTLGARRADLTLVAAPALPVAAVPRGEVRRRLGAAPDEVVVLTVARLAPQKNLRMVLDVAAAVRDRPDLVFWVVGDGPLRAELAGQVTAQRTRVRLLGHRDDVADLLGASDVVLLTSHWEARAMVAQEALLAGVPLVSTRVGGAAELVGDAARLVGPGDVAGAAAELRALADDPGRRAELAAAGRVRAATWPDEDAVADALLAAYQGLRTGRDARGG